MHKIVTGHAPSSSPGRVKAPPATLVVFGAGGDLTRRLLVPSIYNLSEAGLLDEGFSVLGVDGSPDAEPAWLDGLDGTLRAFVGDASAEFHPDRIVIGIDPHQDVEIAFDVKRPGPYMRLADATARFDFAGLGEPPNVGYEVLIYDALLGDATLFQRADAIKAAWAVVDPILSGHEGRPAPRSYAAGTEGPDAASTLAPLGWSSLGPADGAPLRSAR